MGRNIGQREDVAVLKAFEDLPVNSLVEIGSQGELFAAGNMNYAAVADAEALIVPSTVIASNQFNNSYAYSAAAYKASTGEFYIARDNGASALLYLGKYDALGNLIKEVQPGTVSTTYYNVTTLILSNGNIALVYNYAGSTTKFSLYTEDLEPIQVDITVRSSTNTSEVCAASETGGFAVMCQETGSPYKLYLYTYANDGTVEASAVELLAPSGTQAMWKPFIAALPTGNYAIAFSVYYSITRNNYYAVYSQNGTAVKALTVLDPSLNSSTQVQIAVGDSSFLVCYVASTTSTWRYRIFDFAGNLVGSPSDVVGVSGASAYLARPIAFTDGYYYSLYSSSATVVAMRRFTEAGVVEVLPNWAPVGRTSSTPVLGLAVMPGAVIALAITGSANPYYFTYGVFDLEGKSLASANVTWEQASGYTPQVIPLSDKAAFFYSSRGPTGSQQQFRIIKVLDTSILGVALSPKDSQNYVQVAVTPGVYPINELQGGVTATFDMTTGTNIYGNKGTILKNSVILKGL